jgi:hypothetical protein
MSVHLDKTRISRYHRKELTPDELLAIDDHLLDCGTCRMAVVKGKISRPSRLNLSVPNPEGMHASFEELASYIDSKMDDVDVSILELHLEDCTMCEREVSDLRKVRDEMATASHADIASIEIIPAGQVRGLGGTLRNLISWKIALPGFALALLVLAGIWQLGERSTDQVSTAERVPKNVGAPADNPTPFPLSMDNDDHGNAPAAKAVLSINDDDRVIELRSDGRITGLESASPSWQSRAKDALASGTITSKIDTRKLVGNNGILMGDADSGVPFGLIEPVGRVELSQRPNFRWRALDGAETYTVRVFDDKFNELSVSPNLKSTSWRPANPLPRGGSYRWQVTAIRDGSEVRSPVRPAPDAKFFVLDAEHASEIENVKRQFPRSNLLLGLAYATGGLNEDARREFESLLRKNPGAQSIRRLIAQVSR